MDAVELLSFKGARELFGTLQAFPRRQFSISELAKTAGLPFTTTRNMVGRFELAQAVDVSLIGKSRAVRFKDSPFSQTVSGILRLSATPQALALPELKRILKAKGAVLEAYLFGSVAANKERLESDVDVAVLVSKAIDVPSLISSIYDGYGVKVVPLVFYSGHELKDFLATKKTVKLV